MPGNRARPPGPPSYGRAVDATLTDLRAEVDARFARLGLPAWPDPHPDRPPPDEQYSRVTDPARYRVVHARGRLWVDVLAEALGTHVSAVAPEPPSPDGRRRGFERGVRVAPPRPDGLPLLLLECDARVRPDDEPVAVLEIAVVRPEVVVARQPDCGCDACDSGSADLLAAVDDVVARVVGGPYVVLRHPRWHAEWHPDGGSGGSDGARYDHDALMTTCRRLAAGENVRVPAGARAFVGRSWLG